VYRWEVEVSLVVAKVYVAEGRCRDVPVGDELRGQHLGDRLLAVPFQLGPLRRQSCGADTPSVWSAAPLKLGANYPW
jgi:hypothetical protein